MNNYSTVGIIIPCFNAWEFMEKCLLSLENQTILPDEVIIRDDYSTDNTYNKLLEYATTSCLNLKIKKNKENVGPGITRKLAWLDSTSQYLCFCDSDDWYELNFIETVKKILKADNLDLIIYDNYIVKNDHRNIANITKLILNRKKKEILALYPMSLWRFVVKKEILENIYCPKIYNGEDAAIAPQIISRSTNILVLDKPLYNYFLRRESVSSKINTKIYKSLIEAFDVVDKYIDDIYFEEKEFLAIKLVYYSATLTAFKANIDNEKIFLFLKNLSKNYPYWWKNKYIKSLKKEKQLYLFFIRFKIYFIAKFIAKLHMLINN